MLHTLCGKKQDTCVCMPSGRHTYVIVCAEKMEMLQLLGGSLFKSDRYCKKTSVALSFECQQLSAAQQPDLVPPSRSSAAHSYQLTSGAPG